MNTESVRVSLGGESRVVSREQAPEVMEELHTKYGGVPSVEDVVEAKANSTFTNLVHDADAAKRIQAEQDLAKSAGVKVDASKQLFATGTRMADVGYATQNARKREHDAKLPVAAAAAQLRELVENEKREDVEVSARDFASNLAVNGKVTAFGHTVSEQAIRGLLMRLSSPALSYVLGLRERIVEELAKDEAERNLAQVKSDKAKIADVLNHECLVSGDTKLKLRLRKDPGDIFAVVSPKYAPADAPEVLSQILAGLPREAKGSFAYDPISTQWELRADIFTPTAVEEQAVGELYQTYASFRARDNGTSSLNGGGGAFFLKCLNASTYVAESNKVSRVHRGHILYDIPALVDGAAKAIHVLLEAWGVNRETVIALPEVDGKKLTIEDAIPGFYRHLLTDRHSELLGVLPGRTEQNVKVLTQAFFGERRNPNVLVRSDLAQGWTKAIQSQPSPVRRNAESAIADWLVNQNARLAYEGGR